MGADLALILGAYLFGALPIIYIIGRLRGVDLREYEDAHIALWRRVGRLEGFIGVVTEFVKGIIAVLVARGLGFPDLTVALTGLAAVVGQMWPVFLKFDGEKGNSVGIAMAGTLATQPFLIALIPMLLGALIRTLPRLLDTTCSREERLKLGGPPSLSLPLGVFIGFAVLPISSWLLGWPLEITLAFVALFILILTRRATAGVRADLKGAASKKSIILNRLLFDRSYR